MYSVNVWLYAGVASAGLAGLAAGAIRYFSTGRFHEDNAYEPVHEFICEQERQRIADALVLLDKVGDLDLPNGNRVRSLQWHVIPEMAEVFRRLQICLDHEGCTRAQYSHIRHSIDIWYDQLRGLLQGFMQGDHDVKIVCEFHDRRAYWLRQTLPHLEKMEFLIRQVQV